MSSPSLLLEVVAVSLAALSGASAFTLPGFVPRQVLPGQHLTQMSSMELGQVDHHAAGAGAAGAAAATSGSAAGKVQVVTGLGAVASRYEAFLIDQWGVMHDGKTAYPGAVECIDRLAEAGKRIVLLSNSSKRKSAALSNLEKMGFTTGDILDVVTSGQIAWDGLQQRVEEPFKSLGMKCVVFGNGDDDLEYVSSCGCELAEAQDADFILARGSFVVVDSEGTRRYAPTVLTGEGKEETHDVMRVMLERGARMLVTNPDFLRPGTNDPMPGLIGRAYTEMGGTVHYVGKPHLAVYGACFRALQESTATSGDDSTAVPPSSVVAVGDSLSHDILGANKAGIHSVFVAGGVHFEELGVPQGGGGVPSDEAFSAAFVKHLGAEGKPTHVVPAFRW